MDNKFLEQFKKDTAVEISKLNYKKYFYQYNEAEKIVLAKEMRDIVDYFQKELEIIVYPVYGTLLGMVREDDFIGHDTDIDMAYMSKCHTEKAVLNEFNMICNFLKEKGLLYYRIKTASHIHACSPNLHLRIDLWISWIDENGKYYLTWIFDGEFNSSIVYPFKNMNFKGYNFPTMNKELTFLDYYYGDWKTPISGSETNWQKHKPVFRLDPWHGK